MSNGYLLIVLACLAAHATAQSPCQQACDDAHEAAFRLCQKTFFNHTASACDGECFQIEIEIRNQCVADAIDALVECETPCDIPTVGPTVPPTQQPTCPPFMQRRCAKVHEHATRACGAAFEAAAPSSGCDGQCFAAALEAHDECLAEADAQLEACLEQCGATQQDSNELLQERDCGCTKEYVPVCGVDGVTYGNQCRAVCNLVTRFYPGECEN